MESDIKYLIDRLAKIDGFGDTGESLLSIVRSKKLPEKKVEPVVAKPETTPEQGAKKDSSEDTKEKSDTNGDKPAEEAKQESK